MTVYGFIGAGNMAGAIVEGLISVTQASSVQVFSAHGSAAALAQRTGAVLAPSAPALVSASDIVVLGVKPQVVPAVLAELTLVLAQHSPLVVSIAAGLSTARLEEWLPQGARLVRAMPNMAAAVGQSMTALCAGQNATDTDLQVAADLMAAVGRTLVLPEHLFSGFTALAGSSPAVVLTLIEALARGGVEAGLPKAQAVEVATQAVLGTAQMVQAEAAKTARGEAGRSPAALVDAVCSPAGTTVAGLIALEKAGFSPAVVAAVEATVARDRELGA
ncbi:pyrroline-5-carboxylate reductase [Actinomyces trachealis]|uniref:pyrroline-5-carboxylate reductase n=1 Tax=Actinomyces trachealis TaxID=2763540 RepID=UPI001892A3F6|nr:pyrroline-5-carboxylate reductase [Actinomyces trachealis]